MINAIVLDEESVDIDGRAINHFELYLEAMDEVPRGWDCSKPIALVTLRLNCQAGVQHRAYERGRVGLLVFARGRQLHALELQRLRGHPVAVTRQVEVPDAEGDGLHACTIWTGCPERFARRASRFSRCPPRCPRAPVSGWDDRAALHLLRAQQVRLSLGFVVERDRRPACRTWVSREAIERRERPAIDLVHVARDPHRSIGDPRGEAAFLPPGAAAAGSP
jgi:hypothetical protein